MPNRVQTYALWDGEDKEGKGGAFRIHRNDAKNWNEKGYGIFHTVQEFFGPRCIKKLVYINAWAVDIDPNKDGKPTKDEMMVRIREGLPPTMLIESKNGYHVYWKSTDATQENWRAIVQNRLVPFYHADKRAKDLARILRIPGFYHMKNPNDPFMVKTLYLSKTQYSEREMFQYYKDLETPKKQKKLHNRTRKEFPQDGSFWDKVWSLDCEMALETLSGTPHVGGETYEFKMNASGTKNIYVNDKSTSCWIDTEGRIGSMDNGGPTVAQWLNYFHKDYTKTIQIIKEVFPQCQEQTMLKL